MRRDILNIFSTANREKKISTYYSVVYISRIKITDSGYYGDFEHDGYDYYFNCLVDSAASHEVEAVWWSFIFSEHKDEILSCFDDNNDNESILSLWGYRGEKDYWGEYNSDFFFCKKLESYDYNEALRELAI